MVWAMHYLSTWTLWALEDTQQTEGLGSSPWSYSLHKISVSLEAMVKTPCKGLTYWDHCGGPCSVAARLCIRSCDHSS